MFDWIYQAVRALRDGVEGLEPRCMSGEQAAKVLERVAEVERLAAVARTLLARRVEETNQWRREGHRSAASFVAAKTSTTVGSAVGALDTARRLERCPATAEAFRAGRLSEAQVREVAAAAVAEPESEHRLLEAASTVVGVAALRDECRRVRSAAAPDEGAAVAAVHRSRYLRHWTDSDGAFRADLRTTPDAGALLVAALAPQIERLRRQSAQAAVRARGDALAADALLALAAGAPGDAVTPGTHPAATVQVRVDAASLVRGATVAGEVCEIPGVGPVPVATARALLPNAVLQALVTRGVDVATVAHAGRVVNAAQRRALVERDPECVVAGCSVREHLEIDHVEGWALTRTTDVASLARLCHWHHALKTYEGWRLEGGPGHWRFLPPEDAGRFFPPEETGRPPPGRRHPSNPAFADPD